MIAEGGYVGVTAPATRKVRTMVDEQTYTLAEAEVILRRQLQQGMCMTGAGAPGHLVHESMSRNADGFIVLWGLICTRCGCEFVPSWPV